MTQDYIEAGMGLILKGLCEKYKIKLDENFIGAPNRVSKMYDELFSGTVDTEGQIKKILESSFPSNYDQMIIVKDVEVFSMCPHHFLPVHYFISLAYIPCESGQVLGLSKLARLAEILARRPVLQEQLTEDIVKYLMMLKGARGVACLVKGVHYCMVMRGCKQNATTITSGLKGVFFEKPEVRQEFFELIKR